MAQTFRYNISALNWLVLILIIAAAITFFVSGTFGGLALGFFLAIVGIFAIERMATTRYTFTDEGLLIIKRGGIARPLSIPVNEILRVERVQGRLLPVSFVLIEYGARHLTSVQTADEEAFISELKRRQRAFDLMINNDEKI